MLIIQKQVIVFLMIKIVAALYLISIKDKKIYKFDDVMSVYRIHDRGIWSITSYYDKMLSYVQLMCELKINKFLDHSTRPPQIYNSLFSLLNQNILESKLLKSIKLLKQVSTSFKIPLIVLIAKYVRYYVFLKPKWNKRPLKK